MRSDIVSSGTEQVEEDGKDETRNGAKDDILQLRSCNSDLCLCFGNLRMQSCNLGL